MCCRHWSRSAAYVSQTCLILFPWVPIARAMFATALLFWISLVGLVYIYAGYPLLVWLAGKVRPATVQRSTGTGPLSIVMTGYNEAHRLPAKLDSLLASSCADQIVEVLIGSDGSTDETAEVVAAYPDGRVRLVDFVERRGKPAVLNDVVPLCQAGIVILTDARQLVDAEALSRLVARFADERVGVVSGELMFRSTDDDTAAATGVGVYWTYEKFIRKCESQFRGVPGATGALYAIRRELFRPVPVNTLLDDVVIPLQAVERGYRCVLEAGAIAWDTPSQSAGQEAIRKRRTIAGCAQLAVNQPRWLLPWRNPIWWEFVSHKLARLSSPMLMLIVLVANVRLAAEPAYLGLLGLQVAFYVSAVVAWWQPRTPLSRWLGVSLMFVSLNVTTVAALWDASRGRFQSTWKKSTS